MTENKVVPKLRFKEFDDDWILKKINKIAPLQRGFDLPLRKIQKGNYPVVYSNGILRTHNEYKVKGEGVVTGRSGTIGKVTFVKENHWPHNTTLWVTNYFNNNKKFIYYFYLQLKLQRFNAGSTVPTLNRNDVHFLNKRIPNQIKEQQKIASFLSAIDEKLQQLTKKKELLEDYKKGIMQKIFSQEIRFKDDSGNNYPDWQEKKLGQIGKTFNGLTGKTKKDFGNGKPFIQYMQIFSSAKIDKSKFGFVNLKENEKQNKVRYGDVFFTTSSETPLEIGYASVLTEEIEELYLNSFCFGFRANSLSELYPDFASYLFRSQSLRKQIVKLAQGSTRYNMSKVQLLKILVKLPSLKEQKKIADFLTLIDNKIENTLFQLEKTKEFKKGLLQQMFV